MNSELGIRNAHPRICPQITKMTQIEHPGLTALPLPLNDSSTSTTGKCPQITQIDPDEFVLACYEQRPSLFERRPRHLSSRLSKSGRSSRDVPSARRPVRRPTATDACIRCGGSFHRRQAIPDLLSFCCQEAGPPFKISDRSLVSWCLGGYDVGGWICVYLRDLRFEMGGWLRVFSVSSVPQWLVAVLPGGEAFDQGAGRGVVVR